MKLFYRGIGSEDQFVETFREDDRICAEHGYDQYPNLMRNMVDGYHHDWAAMRFLLHDFAQRLFR